MAEIGDIAVRVGANIEDLKKGMGDASKSVGSFSSSASSSLKSFAGSVATVGAASIAAGAALAAGLIGKGMEAVDAQAKLARQLGGTVTGLRTLQNAAGDAGVSSDALSSAMSRLNRTIGNALTGNETAAKSFQRLGLDAQQLSMMDVDSRMAAIADAVKGMGLNSQEAASALKGLGITQAEIINLVTQGGDAIRSEAETTKALGLAISQVDAAKIEAANQAMGIFGDIVDGVSTQLAVEASPIITALATMLEDVAKEAGGVGHATSTAFQYVVDAAAFVIDAIDGIKRAFTIVSDGIIIAFSAVARHLAEKISGVLELVSHLPGVDFSETISSLNDFSNQATGVIGEAWTNINTTLEKPLAGETFKKFVEDARVAGTAAAEAAVQAQAAVMGAAPSGAIDTGAEAKQIQAEKDLEILNKKNADELEAIKNRFITEEQLLAEHRELMNVIGSEYDATKFESEAQWRSITEQAEAEHQARLTALTQKEAMLRKQALGDALTQMTALMNTNSRKAFEVGKAAAISQTILSTYEAAQKSYAALAGIPVVGPALGAAAAGAAILNGMARVSAIRSQSFGSGGGVKGSVTDQVNSNSGSVGGGGGGNSGGSSNTTYRFEGLTLGSIVSGDMVIQVLKQAQKDGALRGNLEFA